MWSTSPALGFMFEWIYLAGLGAKVKRDWAKPRISPFRRQFRSSITRHWREFFEILALQYQGTMQPHACASWLKCPSYAAPVEPAKGSRVGDRVQYVTLINRYLVIVRLLHSLVVPVSSSFPKIPAEVQYQCIYRRRQAASVCKPPTGFKCWLKAPQPRSAATSLSSLQVASAQQISHTAAKKGHCVPQLAR